jgi:hypothetical protein
MNTLELQDYVRKPFPVKCIQVTPENMSEVAKWCGGKIRTTTPKDPTRANKYIQVEVPGAQKDRHSRAYAHDWVLHMNNGYKVYNDRAFKDAFEPPRPVEDETPNVAVISNSGSGQHWFTQEERNALRFVTAFLRTINNDSDTDAESNSSSERAS